LVIIICGHFNNTLLFLILCSKPLFGWLMITKWSFNSFEDTVLIKENLMYFVVGELDFVHDALSEQSIYFFSFIVKEGVADTKIAENFIFSVPNSYLSVSYNEEILIIYHSPYNSSIIWISSWIVLQVVQSVELKVIKRNYQSFLCHGSLFLQNTRIISSKKCMRRFNNENQIAVTINQLMKVFGFILFVLIQNSCLFDKHVHVLLNGCNQVFFLLFFSLQNISNEKSPLL